MTEYLWEPLTPAQAAEVLNPLGIDWWIAGGVAIGMFVGHKTREHGDLDTAVLRRDVASLAALLPGWDINIAHDGKLTPWDGGALADEMHQFWSRRRGADAWAFEILLEYTDGDDWLYRRDNRIRRPISSIGRRAFDGIPYLAPEICLLYKSKSPRIAIKRNEADFDAAAPLLDPTARVWLREDVLQFDPQHPWAERLGL